MIDWVSDYALDEATLKEIKHTNLWNTLQIAMERLYNTEKYEKRGEFGELFLHAVSREFFDTVPISWRVFYKTSPNDVVKGFDLVHAREADNGKQEIWFGEAKTYKNAKSAISAAIRSINGHLDRGFLSSQKFLLGAQVPSTYPHRAEVVKLFDKNTSLDLLIERAVFPIGVVAESPSLKGYSGSKTDYQKSIEEEFEILSEKLSEKSFNLPIEFRLFYLPIIDKKELLKCFHKRIKGIKGG